MSKKRFAAALAALAATGLLMTSCAASPESKPAESSDGSTAPLYNQLPDWAKEEGKLTFVGDSHPPYRTLDTDGSVSGMDPELLELLSEQLGVEIELEIASGMDAMLTGMRSGRYDAFNGPVQANAEREANFDAIAYMSNRTAYVFLEENQKELGGDDAGNICGVTVAGIHGSITETEVASLNEWCVSEGKEASEFLGLADTNATVLAVQSGRADALSLTSPGALDLIRVTPDTFAYVTQSDEQGSRENQLAMLAPRDNELGPVLLAAMQNLFDDGTYAEYMDQWGLSDVTLDAPIMNPVTGQ